LTSLLLRRIRILFVTAYLVLEIEENLWLRKAFHKGLQK
jgi:hypothetical protein